MAESPEEYLAAAPDAARPWLVEFWEHVRARNADLTLTMFRGVPMFKFGGAYNKDGYVMFTAAAKHFSVHSIEFDLVAAAQRDIAGAFGGKGAVSVKYANEDAKPALKAYVDEVLRRRGFLA